MAGMDTWEPFPRALPRLIIDAAKMLFEVELLALNRGLKYPFVIAGQCSITTRACS